MCGRFALTVSPENISKYFHVEDVPEGVHQYNIAPSHSTFIRKDAEA